jgi:hypothetical protein
MISNRFETRDLYLTRDLVETDLCSAIVVEGIYSFLGRDLEATNSCSAEDLEAKVLEATDSCSTRDLEATKFMFSTRF